VPTPTLFICLFAAEERLDAWVFRAAIAIPVLCVAGLFLWHLVGYVAARIAKPRKGRPALEPRPPGQFPGRLADEPAAPGVQPALLDALARALENCQRLAAQSKDDPEQLQQIGVALEDCLAEISLELAESWLRKGRREQAIAALQKILQSFPHSRHALAAQDRLRQLELGRETRVTGKFAGNS
jgi:tetratricopeptide (TPR) repeat protein